MTSPDLNQLTERLKRWGNAAVTSYGANAVYLFGSLIHKGGQQFNNSSDVDLVIVIPNLPDALARHRWLETFGEHKETIEIELLRTLRRAGTEPSVSIVAVTDAELKLDIHKDGHRQFFTANTFRDLNNDTEVTGINGAGTRAGDRFLTSSMAFTQKIRNEHFAVSANGTPHLTAYEGPDALPKRIMRAAAMAARAAGQTAGPGAEHDVQEGLDILSQRLYDLRGKAPQYRELQDLVSVRRGARGRNKSVDPTHQLLLAELIYDIALSGGAPPMEGPESPSPSRPATNIGPIMAPGAELEPVKSPNLPNDDHTDAPIRAELQMMPSRSSTAFFAERFASAFPGVRSTTWYDEPDEIATRLEMLLKTPLSFSDGTPIWWWRGGNLHIERFERLTPSEFIMNVDELKIVSIAAVPSQAYKRHFVYVQTDAMAPTGLYPRLSATSTDFVEENGYDYEEYGLLRDGHLLTRAEYDDGHAMIGGKLVNIRGLAELRSRYITPYNFVIAAQGSPINNNAFDEELEDILNAALKGNPKDQVERLRSRVAKLPLLRSLDD